MIWRRKGAEQVLQEVMLIRKKQKGKFLKYINVAQPKSPYHCYWSYVGLFTVLNIFHVVSGRPRNYLRNTSSAYQSPTKRSQPLRPMSRGWKARSWGTRKPRKLLKWTKRTSSRIVARCRENFGTLKHETKSWRPRINTYKLD